MAVYQYTQGSLLNEVQILTNETSGKRAYMHAREDGSSEQLRGAKQTLRALGYQCVPTVREGKPMLEVRGFDKNEEFIGAITQAGLVSGQPSKVVADVEGTKNLAGKAKNQTLKLAGLSYNIGDLAYMWYVTAPVVKEWSHSNREKRFFDVVDVLSGVGYGLGSLCLTFFGAKDQSINIIKNSTKKIERFARKEGYQVPDESSISYVNTEPKHSFFGKVKATIARYPSEALNSIYVFVGLGIAAASFYKGTRPISREIVQNRLLKEAVHDGSQVTAEAVDKALKTAKSDRVADLMDVGLGAVTMTSALIGIGVKETKRMEGEPKRGGLGGAIDWIREKPLRATGIGYMIATAWHGASTVQHWQKGSKPKPYLYGRAVFIAANIFSEVMLTLSSKGHGTGVKPDDSVDDTVMATAAELVLRQPEEKREPIIRQLAGYMASPEVLATKADEVEKQLRVHIDLLDNNPWTRHFVGHEDIPVKQGLMPPFASDKPSEKISNVMHANRVSESVEKLKYV